MTTKLQIIGGGRMGQALASGLVRTGWCRPEELLVVDPAQEIVEAVGRVAPGSRCATEAEPDVDTLLAVKPHLVRAIANDLPSPARVLSVAAGVSSAMIEAAVGDVPVLRAMPNTPALIGKGASALAAGRFATGDDLDWGREILEAVGLVVVVPEDQIDLVTGLSGSGPAYVYLLAEAMVDGAVARGLPRPVAEALAFRTIEGAGAMLCQGGESSFDLRVAVTTPGGTTAAGLAELERHGVRHALAEAVSAAARRAGELG